MIAEMKVGSNITVDLLVKESQIKHTRAGKPYLYMVLSDGKEDVKAQDWDFGDNEPPAKGTVVNMSVSVGEYMGNKQLKVNTITHSDVPVHTFAPQGNVNVEGYAMAARALIEDISNVHLRQIVQNVFNDNKDYWKVAPAASGIHHAYIAGLLQHTVDVTSRAKAIAKLTTGCNVDLVVAGAMLHDMGKLWTYELNGALIERSHRGMMLEHIVLGIIGLEKYRTEENSKVLDLLQHIISSHHGVREYGSPTTPMFVEAVIVNYADGVDAKTKTIMEANEKAKGDLTDRLWTMENNQMFTQSYIADIMEG